MRSQTFVSRMRRSAKLLRSGAPLVRDRSKRRSLERSRFCSAPPTSAALRPGHMPSKHPSTTVACRKDRAPRWRHGQAGHRAGGPLQIQSGSNEPAHRRWRSHAAGAKLKRCALALPTSPFFLCLGEGVHPNAWLLLNTIEKQSLFRAGTKKPGTPFGPGHISSVSISRIV